MLERNGICAAAALALCMLLAAQETHAQIMQPAVANVGRAYVGASAGVVIPSDLHANFGGGIAGSGDFSFKTGGAGSGFIGYHLNDLLALEGELGVASSDADKFSGTLNGTAVSASIDGSLTTVFVFGNAILTPFGRAAAFTPYVGGGIGFASIDDSINSIGGVNVASSGRETDFAANFTAGLDFAVANRWSVGARYRFIWVNTASSATSGGVNASIDDVTAHIITATATFHF